MIKSSGLLKKSNIEILQLEIKSVVIEDYLLELMKDGQGQKLFVWPSGTENDSIQRTKFLLLATNLPLQLNVFRFSSSLSKVDW